MNQFQNNSVKKLEMNELHRKIKIQQFDQQILTQRTYQSKNNSCSSTSSSFLSFTRSSLGHDQISRLFPSNMNYFPWQIHISQEQAPEIHQIVIPDPYQLYFNLHMTLMMAQENFQGFPQLTFINQSHQQQLIKNQNEPSEIQINTQTTPKIKKKDYKDVEKEISSARKNSESNLVNQFFSFFNSRQKSSKIVLKAMGGLNKNSQTKEKIVNLFFNVVHHINKSRGRKYVNRSLLQNMFTPENLFNAAPQLEQKMRDVSFLTKQQLCKIFRKCVRYFLKAPCINVILTSKRISIISKDEHFRKRRKIFKNMLDN